MKNKNISSSKRSDSDKEEITKDIIRTTTALSASETVNRFGSANAEFIKGYTGTDKETGQIFSKGLEKIFTHKFFIHSIRKWLLVMIKIIRYENYFRIIIISHITLNTP